MLFAFPNKRIGDTCWFLSKENQPTFGKVSMITIAIKPDECSVWYNITNESGDNVINEKQVIEGDVILPTPKYKVGDQVTYGYPTKNNSFEYDIGTIERIEVVLTDKESDILYIMEEDPDYWVRENEIETFSETTLLAEES